MTLFKVYTFLFILIFQILINKKAYTTETFNDFPKTSYTQLIQTNEATYEAQIEAQNLKFVMTRIDGDNAHLWKHYTPNLKEFFHCSLPPETWGAYIASTDTDLGILMFITVVFSPQSLVSTHINSPQNTLQATYEHLFGSLNSFAAHVTCLRNPACRYMINTFSFPETLSLINILPSSVHIGTQEQQSELEKKQMSFEEFSKKYKIKIRKGLEIQAEANCDMWNNPPYPITKSVFPSSHLMIVKESSGHFVVSQEAIEAKLEQAIQEEYQLFINPFSYPLDTLISLMKTHSPILSFYRNELIIYDSENILRIKKTNETYEFLFVPSLVPRSPSYFFLSDQAKQINNGIFDPILWDVVRRIPSPPYCVIDLKTLADIFSVKS